MATATHPSTSDPIIPREESYAVIAVKIILVAAVIAGLVAATFFSGGALLGLIAAGAATWKIGFTAIAFGSAAISTMGAVYFAITDGMLQDTDHNWKDAKKFATHSLFTAAIVANAGISFFRDLEIWKMIFSE